jgi:hypothetical protein
VIRLFVVLRLGLQALASAWFAAEAGLAASAKAWSASAARTSAKALRSTKSWLSA